MLPVPAEELPVESQENAPVASPFKTALVMSVKAVPLMFGPNITGSIVPETRNDDTLQGEFSGAFSQKEDGQQGATGTDYLQGHVYGFAFSAFSSNSIYGASSSVQPPALRVLPCIKL